MRLGDFHINTKSMKNASESEKVEKLCLNTILWYLLYTYIAFFCGYLTANRCQLFPVMQWQNWHVEVYVWITICDTKHTYVYYCSVWVTIYVLYRYSLLWWGFWRIACFAILQISVLGVTKCDLHVNLHLSIPSLFERKQLTSVCKSKSNRNTQYMCWYWISLISIQTKFKIPRLSRSLMRFPPILCLCWYVS